MTVVTRDFNEAHARLRERAELLADAAKVLPAVSRPEREALRDDIVEFLREQVVPHTVLDERVLFPEVSRRLGDPLATATMNYDHVAIRDWIDDVATADLDDTALLQRLLYGLHALIQVHIWKEERLYLTLLESPSWPAG
jgi:hemerythrin-like domain-containing protein